MCKERLYGKHQVRIFRSFSKQSVKSDLRVPLHFALNSVLQINHVPICFTKLNNTATEINNSRKRQSQQVIGLGNSCFQLRFEIKWQNYSALFYTTVARGFQQTPLYLKAVKWQAKLIRQEEWLEEFKDLSPTDTTSFETEPDWHWAVLSRDDQV